MFSGLVHRRKPPANALKALPSIPYNVRCSCGQDLAGERGAKAVTVSCPKCHSRTLIFPASPLMQLRQSISEGLRRREAAPGTAKPAIWRRPLLAAGLALVGVICLFLILLNFFFKNDRLPSLAYREVARDQISAGRRALADENLPLAVEHFRHARNKLEQYDGGKTSREYRWQEQVEKESELMNDLLPLTLGEILERANGQGEEAWKRTFRARFEGKSMLFDAQVQSVGAQVYRIDYPVLVAGIPTRVEMHNPDQLRSLKIEWPQRMLIGVRLGSARRDARGNWMVAAQPERVVLFTEPLVFRGTSLPIDDDMVEILRRQAIWLDLANPESDP